MSQIAKAAGVSRSAVSFVLNNVPDARIGADTRQRILDAARKLNYVPDSAATRLAGGNIGTIALVLRRNQHQVITDRFLAQALFGISAAVKGQGFSILVEPLDPADLKATYGNLVRSRRADGMIVWGPRIGDEELNRIHAEGFPIVLIGSLPASEIPSVGVDNVNAARTAVNHLLGLGHQRIACITEASLDYYSSRDRLAGYRLALKQSGLFVDEQLIRHADFTDEGGARAMTELLDESPRPTAVFAGSDVVALGALGAIRATRTFQVPDDIALVGFGDIPLAEYVVPSLTTIRVPAYELGFSAGEMLTRSISVRRASVESITLDVELIVRQSCGATIL